MDFDSKKIEKRIQRLEQEKEAEARKLEQEVEAPAIKKLEVVEDELVQTYPETEEALTKALKELAIKKELANINRDVKGLEALLVQEKEMKRRLKNIELAEIYGKEEGGRKGSTSNC